MFLVHLEAEVQYERGSFEWYSSVIKFVSDHKNEEGAIAHAISSLTSPKIPTYFGFVVNTNSIDIIEVTEIDSGHFYIHPKHTQSSIYEKEVG